ncbi:hypothetical protein [Streptomyces sp. WAC 01529]|uniref:hypothetical protein n=1 Tax=Streptomyces sp. WAC 01529 TaxID=2203205 RepID=UPI0013DED9F7|nr:hypothetical protein [Streptomyces sp. WAC 01529]
MLDFWKLIELLHSSRHPAQVKVAVTECPFHEPRAFEAEARRLTRLARLGIGRRS